MSITNFTTIESGYIYSNAKMQYIKVYEEDAKVH